MRKNKRYRLSLRNRIALITGGTLLILCVILAFAIIKNAQMWIIVSDGKVVNPSMQNEEQGANNDDISIPIDSVDEQIDSITNFYNFTIITVVAILVVGFVVLYYVIGISIKPVKKLENEIGAINENDLSKRIDDFSAGDELESLAKSFNQMLDRIQQAFDREKSFSAGAAHELKTPLAVVKTNIDVLRLSENPTKEEYEETLEIVKKQMDRMTKLVEDLFTMCTLNGYQMDEQISINSMINEIITEQEKEAKVKNIKILAKPMPETIKINGNSVMIKHAISNLIQNAIKYNVENGFVDVQCSVEGSNCKIVISDNGIGISEEASKHIFEPFYREDKSRSRKIGGAGLGLSIVKNIILQHGGEVFYSSNTPKGSKFTIKLPI